MNAYLVTLTLIIGYQPDDCSLDYPEAQPITKNVYFEVEAENEDAAISEVKWNRDKSGLSVWESYAELL